MRKTGLLLSIVGPLLLALIAVFHVREHLPLERDGVVLLGRVLGSTAVHQGQGRHQQRMTIWIFHEGSSLEVDALVDPLFAAAYQRGATVAVLLDPARPERNRAGIQVERLAAGEITQAELLATERRFVGTLAGGCILLGLLGATLLLRSRPARVQP